MLITIDDAISAAVDLVHPDDLGGAEYLMIHIEAVLPGVDRLVNVMTSYFPVKECSAVKHRFISHMPEQRDDMTDFDELHKAGYRVTTINRYQSQPDSVDIILEKF